MEESNIVYTGITQAASDLDCADGDLSLSHNLVSQNGAMRPLVLPDAAFTMEEGERLAFVHSGAGYKNFLYVAEGSLRAFQLDESGGRADLSLELPLNNEAIRQLQSVGNTLVVYTDGGATYLLFKEGQYKVLGDELPEVFLQFGLTGRTRLFSYSDDSKSTFDVTFDDIDYDKLEEPWSEENQVKITEQVMAKVNKFMREQVTEKGRFCFPFFARCALRLYDGTLAKHSAPVLMLPSTTTAPVVMWTDIKADWDLGEIPKYNSAKMDIMLVAATLNYRILPTAGATALKDDWGDIVKGIDLFISPPIYTYDTGGMCTSFQDTDNFSTCFIGRLADFEDFRTQDSGDRLEDEPYLPLAGWTDNGDGTYDYPFKGKFLEWPYSHLYGLMYAKDRKYPALTVHLPEKAADQRREDILDQSLFYYVDSIRTEHVDWGVTHDVEIGESYLENLTLKERMTDDWQTHDRLLPSYSYVYNQRLNIANVRRELFDGFPALAMFCRKDGIHEYVYTEATRELDINTDYLTASTTDIDIYTYLNEDNRDIVLKATFEAGLYAPLLARFVSIDMVEGPTDVPEPKVVKRTISWPPFLYYPNPNAYKMVLVDVAHGNKLEVPLKEHDGLNGSYALLDFDRVAESMDGVAVPTPSADKVVDMPNKIYTSEVGNPFFFPLEGVNTVGVGEIVGISSTTRALSQGQFGQFPLLVFATDGIWAMEVSDTGLYSAKQPVSRDVCSNPPSITQTDGAVIFVTEKGVMVVDGSRVDLLSAELDGPSFDPARVWRLDEVLAKEGLDAELGALPVPKDFFAACRIAYDYPNARLLLFVEDAAAAYVYSLNSRTWATMTGGFVTAVADYPGCYVQMADGTVIDISAKQDFDSGRRVKTLLLTRPLKLGDYALKTVNAVISRGRFPADSGAAVVFASLDGRDYVPIGSAVGRRLSRLQGSPYRYFRLCVVREMDAGQSLSATSVYFTRKWRNKPR